MLLLNKNATTKLPRGIRTGGKQQNFESTYWDCVGKLCETLWSQKICHSHYFLLHIFLKHTSQRIDKLTLFVWFFSVNNLWLCLLYPQSILIWVWVQVVCARVQYPKGFTTNACSGGPGGKAYGSYDDLVIQNELLLLTHLMHNVARWSDTL